MPHLTPYKHDDLAIILECAKSHLNTITFIRTQAQAFINKQSGDLYLTIDAIEAGDIASKPVNTKAFTILQNASQLVNDAHSVESDIRLRLAILSVGVLSLAAFESKSSVMCEARSLESLAIASVTDFAVRWVEMQKHITVMNSNR